MFPQPNFDTNSPWITHVRRPAMATEFAILLPAQHQDAVEQALHALERLDEIEARLTVYRPESEISTVNRFATERPVTVSPETFSILQRAIYWSKQTGGRFDITAGPFVEAWGFSRRRDRIPTAEELRVALDSVGFEKLRLDAETCSVQFSVQGMSINLGGIGKGYAIDELTRDLKRDGVSDFLIHGGQSSLYAAGRESIDADGWSIGIAHPTRKGERLAGVWLRDAALGTSGSGNQFFHYRGKRFGHVIDPRNGSAANDRLTLSVVCDNAMDADAASTGLYLTEASVLDHSFAANFPIIQGERGERQDEVIVSVRGSWNWIDPPAGYQTDPASGTDTSC